MDLFLESSTQLRNKNFIKKDIKIKWRKEEENIEKYNEENNIKDNFTNEKYSN